MGILKGIFKSDKKISTSVVSKSDLPETISNIIPIHSSLENLLWIADGPKRNYSNTNTTNRFNSCGLTYTISFSGDEEPSLIYLSLPANIHADNVDLLPYYPRFKDLTPEQRGMYWRFLSNPYKGGFEIGYVFILYYGLERQLLLGDYESAIRVIIKLRDVYDNRSFQSYSASAIILTCLKYQRADLAYEFMDSLDKDYELFISDNLYLLCKYSLDIPISAKDIMRMAKSFEYTKRTYIKDYPDLFLDMLSRNMLALIGKDEVRCRDYISERDFKKLPTAMTQIFANISISENQIEVPLLIHAFRFKRAMFDLLNKTHDDVKKALATMRKAGDIPQKNGTTPNTKKDVVFDSKKEKELIKAYKRYKSGTLDQHFASIDLQNFYYKYRNLDDRYLEECIKYCIDDISKLNSINESYRNDEISRIKGMSMIYTKKEINEMITNIGCFDGSIPAFKRLAIVYEKRNDYEQALKVCDEAIAYYNKIGHTLKEDFEVRKERLIKITTEGNKRKDYIK